MSFGDCVYAALDAADFQPTGAIRKVRCYSLR
jgi:hypothetical protein